MRGTPACRVLASSFAFCFLAADELAHLPQSPTSELDWKAVEKAQKELETNISYLQAHLGEEVVAALGVSYGKIEQGLFNNDIIEVHQGAEKIQRLVLQEGLIAVAQECSIRGEN